MMLSEPCLEPTTYFCLVVTTWVILPLMFQSQVIHNDGEDFRKNGWDDQFSPFFPFWENSQSVFCSTPFHGPQHPNGYYTPQVLNWTLFSLIYLSCIFIGEDCDKEYKEALKFCKGLSKSVEVVYNNTEGEKVLTRIHFKYDSEVSGTCLCICTGYVLV